MRSFFTQKPNMNYDYYILSHSIAATKYIANKKYGPSFAIETNFFILQTHQIVNIIPTNYTKLTGVIGII